MRQEYKDELKELKSKMEKAEKFAEKLPFFSGAIIERKLSGEEVWSKFGERYRDIYLNWGINRGFYKKGAPRSITNYGSDDYAGYFFCIYINSLSLYNSYEKHGIYEALSGVDIFFIDHSNTTFYISDENIEDFLEALNDWYLVAREEASKASAQERIETAKKQIEQAEAVLEKEAKL